MNALQSRQDDAILGIQYLPAEWAAKIDTDSSGLITTPTYQTSIDFNLSFNIGLTKYDVVNNKCFNYPYFCLSVGDGQGRLVDYAFEDIGSSNVSLTLYGEIALNAGTMIHINGYKGLPKTNHTYDFSGATYPQAQFASDSSVAFQQEQMAARNSAKLNSMNAGLSTVSNFTRMNGATTNAMESAPNPVSLGSELGTAAANVMFGQQIADVQNQLNMDLLMARQNNTPSTIHNTTGNSNISMISKSIKPFVAVRHAPAGLMRIIDNYFTCFGYQVNRLKKPNITGRPAFNYVKTANAIVTGAIPADVRSEIETRLNSGMTFWHSTANVGNYSVTNK